MFIILTLGMVVLAHMFTIGVVIMALAAAWGIVLYLTRPTAAPAVSAETRTYEPDLALEAAGEPAFERKLTIPAQSGERDPQRPVGAGSGPRR